MDTYKRNNDVANDIIASFKGDDLAADRVRKWTNDTADSEYLIDILCNKEKLCAEIELFQRNGKEMSAQRLIRRIKRKVWKKRISIAASIAAVICAIGIFISQINNQELIDNNQISIISKNFSDNLSAPTLITATGQMIELGNKSNSAKLNTIAKVDLNFKESSLNTIIIPFGCSYSVELPDGTRVWLNACSRMSYPRTFENVSERRVILKGEAYFDVSKNNKPFIVEIADLQIKVFGTKFNVKTKENNNIQTVLVEGSVGITNHDNKCVMLAPNQKAETSSDGNTQISSVDAYRYTAWMSGFFVFDNVTLKEMLTELSKWYNVDFHFLNQEAASEIIMASFDKHLHVNEVINMLGAITNVKFDIEGRSIYVK